jgi:crossover junction endodeoxyribonuclease RuvC
VGYGIIECRTDVIAGGDFDYVECGVIVVPPADEMAIRLHRVSDTLAEIIAEFEPQVLAIEKAFHGRNAASALKLGQARGAIMLTATQHGLRVVEYAPARIKQWVAGHGRATKEQIQQRVTLLLGLNCPPQADAADALAIAVCHGHAARVAPRILEEA